jgi:hypothetical protein
VNGLGCKRKIRKKENIFETWRFSLKDFGNQFLMR